MSYSPSGRLSHSTKALIIETTSVDDEPRPEPGGASVWVVIVSGSGWPPLKSRTMRL